jgi:hypothetical protein
MKTKYVFISDQQNVGQNYNLKKVNKFFENVAKLKTLFMKKLELIKFEECLLPFGSERFVLLSAK